MTSNRFDGRRNILSLFNFACGDVEAKHTSYCLNLVHLYPETRYFP